MKFRQFFFLIGLILVGILVINRFGDFGRFIHIIGSVNLAILSSILVFRYLSYWINVKYYEHFFAIYDEKTDHRTLFKAVITMNFVNTIIPTGGISGTSYISRVLEPKIKGSLTTAAQFFWYVTSYIGYVIFLALGFVLLILSNQLGRLSSRGINLIMVILLVVSVVAIVIASNRSLAEQFSLWALQPVNAVLARFKKKRLSKIEVIDYIDEVYKRLDEIRSRPHSIRAPLTDAILYVLFEVMSIYVVFLAFGKVVNPGIVIAGYLFALLFSLASFFSSGIGIYEATMVGIFVALGIPFELSFSIVFVYRFIALWLFLPVGLYYYKQSLIDDEAK